MDDELKQFIFMFDMGLIENAKGQRSECSDGVGMIDKGDCDIGWYYFNRLAQYGVKEDHFLPGVGMYL
ncbi:MAG: hypothetical protein KDD45_07880 [Bdellovibrionales bacterium]|nr:hypothetical protein [Bdellovibrionales bacterium]